MHLKFFFSSLRKVYIIFFITVLFLNFSTSELKSSIFKVNDIEISEPFDLNFKKEKVIDKAFKEAFKQLIKMAVVWNVFNFLNSCDKEQRLSHFLKTFETFSDGLGSFIGRSRLYAKFSQFVECF